MKIIDGIKYVCDVPETNDDGSVCEGCIADYNNDLCIKLGSLCTEIQYIWRIKE